MKNTTIFREGLFKGKTALVTGGASGIGLEITKELCSLGCNVIIMSRNLERLKAAITGLQLEEGSIEYIVANIRDEEQVQQSIADWTSVNGAIDLLVNNAGGQFPSLSQNIKPKGWRAVIDTNLNGTFWVSQAVFKHSMRSHGGNIVNIIANVERGFPWMSHTGAARAGVENLTKSLATEWGRHNIRVNAIAPGTIHSSGLETYDIEFKQQIIEYGKFNQTGRLGTEAEVAAAVLFLLSPAASFITGETLKVDGAESLFHPFYPPSSL